MIKQICAIACISFACLFPISASAMAIISEGFSEGNPVSFTDYNLVSQGTATSQQNYRVVNNPNPTLQGGSGYDSYYDHTLGTAAGEMMFFDGAASSSDRIWYHTASLLAGTTYTFSFWGSAANTQSNPTLQESVSGTTLSGTLATTSGIWSEFSDSFTVPTSGTYTLAIFDSNTVMDGNDGAIDDVLVTAVPEPIGACAFFLGAIAILRHRRASSGPQR